MKKILIRISAFFMLALLAVGVSPTALTLASAESAYTSVMQDLEKGGVSEADYPIDNADYSIKVIQIAESTGGELFVYTYQPRQTAEKLVATCINMGLSEELDEDLPADPNGGSGESGDNGNESGGDNSGNIGGNGGGIGGSEGGGGGGGGSRPASYTRTAARAGVKTKLYDLSLVSSQSVFCKYLVKDITVSTAAVRYYNITSIYRKYIDGIDEITTGATVNGQIINEKAYEVGELFTARTDESGKVIYSRTWTETIVITDKYCGKLSYRNGYQFFGKFEHCDAWYVAFSTDKRIEKLFEADVSYITKPYINEYFIEEQTEQHSKTIRYTDRASNTADGLFGYQYTWDRISSTADFLKENDEKLSSDDKTGLTGKEWVLRFEETEVLRSISPMDIVKESGTHVSEVTILRLKFETDGKVYNLGVVDNKQSQEPFPPTTDPNFFEQFLLWLESVTGISRGWWIAIAVLLVLAILMPILSVIFPVVRVVLKRILKGIGLILLWIFKGLWWLISLPFRLIARAVQKRKGEKDNGE